MQCFELHSCNRGTRLSHVPASRAWLLCEASCCMHVLIFIWCMYGSLIDDLWLFSLVQVPSGRMHATKVHFHVSDLHIQAAVAASSPNQNFFLPFLPNGKPDWAETWWACYYHHYASPIANSWSMDARISKKIGKWLKISELNFSETVHRNWLKLLG